MRGTQMCTVMSETFLKGSLLHSELSVPLRVYDACINPRASEQFQYPPLAAAPPKLFFTKTYTLSTITAVDSLLKEALQLIAARTPEESPLVEVELHKPPFTVDFVFEKWELDSVFRNDTERAHRSGLDGYTVTSVVYNNEDSQVSVCTALSDLLSEEVVVKTYSRGALFELNLLIREGVYQARVASPHCCNILDIALVQTGKRFSLSLVLEKMSHSLLRDVHTRLKPYPETELRRCIREVAAGLQHAKSLVSL